MKRPYLIICTGLLTFSCLAAEDNYSKVWRNCMDASQGVTAAIVACNSAESDSQNRRLNANYQSYLNGMSTDVKQNFIRAQRLWIKFRDENCGAFTSQEAGGSLAAIVGSGCYLKMTAERADDFDRHP